MTSHEANSPPDRESVSPQEPAADVQPGCPQTSAAISVTSLAGLDGARAATAASNPAAVEPAPAGSDFDAALWHRQDMLSDLREWIEALPGIETSGYITNINDPAAGSTVLVWHGPSNPIQQQILDEARRRHISISIQQRKYTRAALEEAVERLSTIAPGTGVFHNFEVSALAAIDIDFDGVTVIGDYIHPPAEGVLAADATLTQALIVTTGVAVTIEHGKFEPL